MKYLTVKQLSDACKAHRYLILRMANGYKFGINGRVASLALRGKKYKLSPNERTDYVSYRPCGILEYIEFKHGFIISTTPKEE